jgi:hypothetical protein
MTTVVWANVLLAIPFLIAFIAVPMWLTFRRPNTAPDHAQAHAYLRAKAVLANSRAAGDAHSYRAAA